MRENYNLEQKLSKKYQGWAEEKTGKLHWFCTNLPLILVGLCNNYILNTDDDTLTLKLSKNMDVCKNCLRILENHNVKYE